MSESIVNSEAIFIGANKQNQVSDYDKATGLIAFGAGKCIALWDPLDPNSRGVHRTLKGHASQVTCIRFIQSTPLMVSASEDFHIKIWKHSPGLNTASEWECIQTIDNYGHTIVTIDVLPGVLAVGCASGTVSLWIQDKVTGLFSLETEFEMGKNILPLCLSLSEVVEDRYLVAVGATSPNIFIYSFVVESGKVEYCKLDAVLEGHEDWVKSISFRHQEVPGDYLLCSGSQDRYIRIWRVRVNDLIEDSTADGKKLTLLKNKQYKFVVGNDNMGITRENGESKMPNELRVCINFEALIMGHDDWISSLQWHESKLQLLASTADTALMVWEPDASFGIWVCSMRLGDVSTKGGSTATGSSGGFWSCMWFTRDGTDYILTNGKTGSWRIWEVKNSETVSQKVAATGNVREVTDIAWSPRGDYLLSTSLDQTTRLYAPWCYNSDGTKRKVITWHEFSRPQIHGYDMVCIEPIMDTRFVSAGDEKILRSFDEPRGVAELLRKFSHIEAQHEEAMPESAALPVLGLSNKAAEDEDEDIDELGINHATAEYEEYRNLSYDIVTSLNTPPTEDQLQRHLLWPEIEKLYGHGYEVVCVAVSPDGKLIASACKSTTVQHATIRLFSTETWLEIKPPLSFHSLTVTRLRFSQDNRHLVAVSRDRKWSVWERGTNGENFSLKYKNEKPHTRIIWDVDWLPLEYGNAFVTGSRDRTIKLWLFDEELGDYKMVKTLKHEKSITAVSVLGKPVEEKFWLATGQEDGAIIIYNIIGEDIIEVEKFASDITPADRVTRLRWSSKEFEGKLLLAASSSDTSTRIYSVSHLSPAL